MGRKRVSRAIMLTVAALSVGLASPIGVTSAHPLDALRAVDEPPTRFERFVVTGCVPCVTESYTVATLPVGALKLPAFPRGGAQPPRTGEIRFEAVRAYQLGRPSRQALALRLTLAVAMGTGNDLYRMAVGLLDEEDVPVLASALSDLASLSVATAGDPSAETVDSNFRGGSLRIGLLRYQGETVAYVQAGDSQVLASRPVWEVPTTMYLPSSELPSFVRAVGRLTAKLKQLRGL